MEKIKIKIKFSGHISTRMGIGEIFAEVEKNKEKAVEKIKNIIMEKAGDQVLYTILLNGVNSYLVDKSELEPEDEFTVVPIILGG